jgi:PKD repeat protein
MFFTKTMLLSIRLKRRLLVALFICMQMIAYAQLKADFTVDKTGGCSPVSVSFTNASTGTTSGTTYEWDFGNGNTSSLKNPGAIFREEKQYTVTLTVKDGDQTSTKTQIVTVYKKPVVEFSASLEKGCAPLPVTFTSTAAAGDGTITQYFWDFGDGFTQQTAGQQLEHTYASDLIPSVSLTVTNSFGCQATLLKEKMITVLPKLTSAFNADEKVLCKISDAANFINSSSGPGVLSYVWDFGDGTTSTSKDPTHVFSTKGTYTIKLKVSSSEGCITK